MTHAPPGSLLAPPARSPALPVPPAGRGAQGGRPPARSRRGGGGGAAPAPLAGPAAPGRPPLPLGLRAGRLRPLRLPGEAQGGSWGLGAVHPPSPAWRQPEGLTAGLPLSTAGALAHLPAAGRRCCAAPRPSTPWPTPLAPPMMPPPLCRSPARWATERRALPPAAAHATAAPPALHSRAGARRPPPSSTAIPAPIPLPPQQQHHHPIPPAVAVASAPGRGPDATCPLLLSPPIPSRARPRPPFFPTPHPNSLERASQARPFQPPCFSRLFHECRRGRECRRLHHPTPRRPRCTMPVPEPLPPRIS